MFPSHAQFSPKPGKRLNTNDKNPISESQDTLLSVTSITDR